MTNSLLLTSLRARDEAYAALLAADVEIAKQRGIVPDTWKKRRRDLWQAWRRSVEEYKRQFAQMRKELQ